MKMFEFRRLLKEKFKTNSVDVCDADFILSEILSVPRTELNLIDDMPEGMLKEIERCVNLRLAGIPVDKIFKRAYFYGLEFMVDENVLTPRPDSEILVETALKYIKHNNYKSVLDLCTGSGCLAIAIKKNCDANLTASDISKKALKIAKTNAKNLKLKIKFVHSNLFDKIKGKFDLIVSNPPYIPTKEIDRLDKEVKLHDPILALDGGECGMDFYSALQNKIKEHLNPGGMLIFEIGEGQKQLITSLYSDFRFIETVKDLIGTERVLVFQFINI